MEESGSSNVPTTSSNTTLDLRDLLRQVPHSVHEVRESTAVILCRGDVSSVDDDDEYLTSLKSAGFRCVKHIPLLHFSFIGQQELLRQLSGCHQQYDGLIFTSVRAVTAIKRCLTDGDQLTQCLSDNWRRKGVFCVGPKTCCEVEERLGLIPTLSNEMGNSIVLAESIVNFYSPKSHVNLLMPCSSSAHDELPSILSHHGLNVNQVHAYDTLPIRDAEDLLIRTIKEFPNMERILVVFFSPSNVKAVSPSLVSLCLQDNPSVLFVAIGPTTEKAIKQLSVPVFCVSSKPDPISLCDSITERLL